MSAESSKASEGTPRDGGSTQAQSAASPEHTASADTTLSTAAVAPTGRRQALQNLRRQLTDSELANPGVQKLLLDQLDSADSDCERLTGYVERFHEADKKSAVLEEKLRAQTAFDIVVGAGIAVGSAVIGLAPSFWDKTDKGPISLAVGSFLVVGAVVARLFRK